MTALELGVVLPQQIEAHTTVDVQISNRDVVPPRRHLGNIHEAFWQPEQNIDLASMHLQPNGGGEIWTSSLCQLVEELIQLLAGQNLDRWLGF
jgi:hypothetical protein